MLQYFNFSNGRDSIRLFNNDQEAAIFGPQASTLNNYILGGLDCNAEEDNAIYQCDFQQGFGWFQTPGCTAKSDEVAIQCLMDQRIEPTRAPTPPPIVGPTQPPTIGMFTYRVCKNIRSRLL